MSIQIYPNGIGGTLGDSLDTCKPLMTTGNVWYVSSVLGIDAAAPRGQDRKRPLATIAQAQTNASDGDIICCLAGHSEVYVSTLPITKKLVVMGEGINAGKPQVTLISNAAAGSVFTVAVPNVEFRNLYFPAAAQANGSAKLSFASGGDSARIRGCYFECGATDVGPIVRLASNFVRIESSTFISTATSLTAQPLMAVQAANGGTVNDLTMDSVIVSSGAFGFSNYSAIDFSLANTMFRANLDNLQLLLGADLDMGTGTTGRVNIQLATGGSRVHWQ